MITDTSSTADVVGIFNQALRDKKAILVKGYTNSDGVTKDIMVVPLPKNGYADICRMSYHMLDDADTFDKGDASPEHWAAAIADRRKAWQPFIDNLDYQSAAPFMKFAGEEVSQHVYRDMQGTGAHLVKGLAFQGADKTVATITAGGKPRKPEHIAKDRLVSQLPIEEYCGQIILAPGKFQTAELVPMDEHSFVYTLFFKPSAA